MTYPTVKKITCLHQHLGNSSHWIVLPTLQQEESKATRIHEKKGEAHSYFELSSVQSRSRVRLFVTPWIAAHQASLSITNSQSSLKLMSIELVMPSSHLILCSPLLLPPIPPSIRVFSNESILRMRWPKYWSFSFSISPSSEHPRLISFRIVLNLLLLNFVCLRYPKDSHTVCISLWRAFFVQNFVFCRLTYVDASGCYLCLLLYSLLLLE